MTRLLPLLLVACTPVSLPPPVVCTVDDLPPGVIAQADLETQTVTLAPGWETLPTAVRWTVLAHELCHIRGHVDEDSADCCAARAVSGYCGRVVALDAALWLQAHGRDVTSLVECVP